MDNNTPRQVTLGIEIFFDIGRNNVLVSSERITTWLKNSSQLKDGLSIRGLKHSVGSLDALSMRITTLSNSLSNLVRGLKHWGIPRVRGLRHNGQDR